MMHGGLVMFARNSKIRIIRIIISVVSLGGMNMIMMIVFFILLLLPSHHLYQSLL